ncbi:MAG: hypothetical protein ACOYI2_10020 [Bacillota bacterium]|jgi:hypothetical protein
MESTLSLSQSYKGLIADSILNILPYTLIKEQSNLPEIPWGSRIVAERYYYTYNLLESVRQNIVDIPWWTIGESNNMSQDTCETELLDRLINGLLAFATTEKVIICQREKSIAFWVISSALDVMTQKKYCYFFADIVDKEFDTEYIFDFRIVGPSNRDLKRIPTDAQVYVRR